MFTCDFTERKGTSLTDFLVQKLKISILSGEFMPDEKLPSKRSLASHLGVSVITVANAYEELISEGYLYSFEKRGFFVTDLEGLKIPESKINKFNATSKSNLIQQPNFKAFKNKEKKPHKLIANFRQNSTSYEKFPFSLWAKVMRSVLKEPHESLLSISCPQGIPELRAEIALYLKHWRNMKVSEEQIVIGAGSEHMFGILVLLLGRNRIFAVENPGYPKISSILTLNGAKVKNIPVDNMGLNVKSLEKSKASVVHVSPSHHFPTGHIMPIKRRHELLQWALYSDSDEQRFIIEDDYDSEFRFTGKPLTTLQSQDMTGAVIYLNTFSKTLSPSYRISYMVLPFGLIEQYKKMFNIYACPVSSFEQHALARFMNNGYFESHLLRMKNYYRSLRNELIKALGNAGFSCPFRIHQEESGLHFLVTIELKTTKALLQESFAKNGLDIPLIEDFMFEPAEETEIKNSFTLVFNYSGLKKESITPAINALKNALKDCMNHPHDSV